MYPISYIIYKYITYLYIILYLFKNIYYISKNITYNECFGKHIYKPNNIKYIVFQMTMFLLIFLLTCFIFIKCIKYFESKISFLLRYPALKVQDLTEYIILSWKLLWKSSKLLMCCSVFVFSLLPGILTQSASPDLHGKDCAKTKEQKG